MASYFLKSFFFIICVGLFCLYYYFLFYSLLKDCGELGKLPVSQRRSGLHGAEFGGYEALVEDGLAECQDGFYAVLRLAFPGNQGWVC